MKIKKQANSNVLVAAIPFNKIKPIVLKGIKSRGLYWLETYFHKECTGHGVGVYGEDISFRFKHPNICFEISCNNKGLVITESLELFSHKDLHGEAYDEMCIDISPELIKFIKEKFEK
jgi:hypothetical protein